MHTTAVKQQNKKYFQKIALQTGQTALFCHGYQEGVFLSLFFDNWAGKITAAKVAIRINGRRRILENSILSILSNPNTPCDLLEIVLQGVMAKLGADNRHILHYQKFIYCRHIKGSVIKPQSMFILHGIILHMKFML